MRWHHLDCWLLLTAASYCNCLPTAVKNLEVGLAHLAGTFKGQLEDLGFLLQEGARFGIGVEGIIWDRAGGVEKGSALALEFIVAFHRWKSPGLL